jgi:hypothetical protein
MNDLFTLISTNINTYEDFRKWLYNKLNKDVTKFKNIGKTSTKFKIPYLIEYLEYKQVPIIEALCYYNYKSSNLANSFEELLTYLIIEEFKRIELKKQINYVPF